ncbi:MAG: SUF system NifU family Fe-S cluster assembly protein [Dehalococcoidia bacterium]|jgi:nitrogen fixation NifU-like protein|nr:SUF system NifU family Fe-S cluster assembly protein [Dehalococcoidia bacterium]MDW8009098.1 SUF system NifU family Fe-S cluster assembly protein [Chloroflexota bacterium]
MLDREELKRQEQSLDDLYRDIILEYYRSPRNRGRLPQPTISREGQNPLCGDEVSLDLLVEDGVIKDARFQGQGCSISQASASMLTEAVRGLTLEQAEELYHRFHRLMTGDETVDATELGDLEALSGVRKFPVRVKCATLAWHVLDEAIKALHRD